MYPDLHIDIGDPTRAFKQPGVRSSLQAFHPSQDNLVGLGSDKKHRIRRTRKVGCTKSLVTITIKQVSPWVPVPSSSTLCRRATVVT